MNLKPHKSQLRMERQVRNQARGLFVVSGVLLVGCSTMTAIFGFSLGRGLVDGVVYSATFAAADIGGAYLISLSGTCSANKETSAARRSAFAAFVCMILTFAGILGFQAENRESQASARTRAMQIVDGFVDWAKVTVAPSPKDKSKGLSADERVETVGKAVKDQLKMLEDGKVAPIADGQATTISNLTGISEAKARSWTIGFTSFVLLFIQYSLWWAYGFTRQRLEPIVSGIAHGPRWAETDQRFPESFRKVSKAEAKSDIAQLVAAGIELGNAECAERWGLSEGEASKWLTEFARAGVMRRVQKGKRKIAVAPLKRLNGNGIYSVEGNA